MSYREWLDRFMPDTSARGTRRERNLPNTRHNPRAYWRTFFAFAGSKVVAPAGYAFNRRGDFVRVQPTKAELRSAARRAKAGAA